MSVKIVYFVHGTTTDNEKGICSGWKNVSLSEKGISQAIELGNNVNYDFDIIYTSDLDRAISSAELAFLQYNRRQDPRLRECNYGDFDGKDKSLVVYEEHIDKAFPNGESLLDVEKRIKEFLDFLKDNFDGKTVGIVAHRAPQLAIEKIVNGLSWEEAIEKDWRKTKDWKPGWIYEYK